MPGMRPLPAQALDLTKMNKLGNIEKEAEGQEMYCYFSGTYQTLENANIQLEKAKLAGFTDAFVFAKLNAYNVIHKSDKRCHS